MKKKLYVLFSIFVILATTTSCMKTEKEPETDKTIDNSSQNYNIEQFDLTQKHISGKLGKNVVIDADITPLNIYCDGLDVYHINNRKPTNATREQFIELLKTCYGADIQNISDIYTNQYSMVTYNSDAGNYAYSSSPSEYLLMETLFQQYPLYSNTDDTSLIDDEVTKFKENFQQFVNYKFCDDYICIHTTEKFYDTVKQIKEVAEIDMPAELKQLKEEEFYFVRICPEVVSGIPELNLKLNYSIEGNIQPGEGVVANEACIFVNNINHADLLFDKTGKLIEFYMPECILQPQSVTKCKAKM